MGCDNLFIAVNHKPLIKTLVDRSLEDNTNTRLRKLKGKSLHIRFTFTKLKAAEAVSRNPCEASRPQQLSLPEEEEKAVDTTIRTSQKAAIGQFNPRTLSRSQKETVNDPT